VTTNMKTLGIWAEEIDALYDHERNGIRMADNNLLKLTGSFESQELCELIHTEGAEVLGVYTDSFYERRPALTVNRLGQGRAYHIATRLGEDFLRAFYQRIVEETGLARALDTVLPDGVTAQVRTDGVSDYVFVMNFSRKAQHLQLDGHSYIDFETGQSAEKEVHLPVNGVRILKR